MLTKSDLQSYLQCPRKLWLEKRRPEVGIAHDSSAQRRVVDGNFVGEMARRELGENFIWPRFQGTPEQAAEQSAAALAASPDRSAAEFPMLAADIYARADALLPENGGYILRETKASTFPLKRDKVTPADPEDHHIADVAIQAWVMAQSGIPMSRAELNLLNGQWRYPGSDNYDGLFRQLDITEVVNAHVASVPTWTNEARLSLEGGLPEKQTGKHCEQPVACQFYEHCKTLDPPGEDHPIELLPDAAGKKLARKLRETNGYRSILEPRPEELTGAQAALYRRIQAAHRTGAPIIEAGSADIMSSFGYPRYYFDFEAIDFPVPRWAGIRPYEQITFQWSCHIERAPGQFEHREFLDLSGNDPSLGCILAMLEAIDPTDGGPIFVYYATYERGRLEELAERHPEHSIPLIAYVERLVDLLPIVRDHFYHPDMKGSFSIKKVLPVVAPDLDYSNLPGAQDGVGAQLAYLEVIDPITAADRRAAIDQGLRAYCQQDTWAMVEVAYFLARVGRPDRP